MSEKIRCFRLFKIPENGLFVSFLGVRHLTHQFQEPDFPLQIRLAEEDFSPSWEAFSRRLGGTEPLEGSSRVS